MPPTSRHVSVQIARPVEVVYAYAADPANLPSWASGLSAAIEQVGDHWEADSPMGRITVDFTPANEYGVLDHTVTLPTGESVYNPFRVIPAGPDTSEAIFTVRPQPGMSDADFDRDTTTVHTDLTTLKTLLEDS